MAGLIFSEQKKHTREDVLFLLDNNRTDNYCEPPPVRQDGPEALCRVMRFRILQNSGAEYRHR